jgi:glutathione S-transferase
MITLYGFGPLFGLPDPSPFVLKTLTQLKMSGLPFRLERASPRAAPKGKIPFIRDGEFVLGDSVFILDHLKAAHGVDLDAQLTPAQKAIGASPSPPGSRGCRRSARPLL